jgi:RNA polymerase sigma-70 factor (sigma-E family)
VGETSVIEEVGDAVEPIGQVDAVEPALVAPPMAGVDGVGDVGDVVGFDAWYGANVESLVRLAYLLVGSQDLARDLTQDAMVRVLRRWRTIEHPDHYARRAVVNACNSHHRRRAVARRHPEPDPASYELEARELTDALARLPYRQRAVVVLRYWGDLPEADIAEALGVKRATVASLLHRAHAQLKEVLER